MGVLPARAMTRVVLPALRPAIATGGILVALYALSDFGAVSLTRMVTLLLRPSISAASRSSAAKRPCSTGSGLWAWRRFILALNPMGKLPTLVDGDLR